MGLKELVLLRIAKRWICGVDLKSAIASAKKDNSRGLGVVVNFLGEEIKDPATADSHTEEYLRLQRALADNSIHGFPSVKLTQLGLVLDVPSASSRLEKIAANSEKLNQWLWVDMEGSKFTDSTISVYEGALENHKRIGVAIQSYLKRTENDLKTLLNMGAKVRLVKGAYHESHDIVLPSRQEIRKNYINQMQMLFDQGEFFALGTHDSVLVNAAKKMSDSKHVDFEFEFLKGIREDLKEELVRSGYKVSDYLPYGDQWYNYSKRRITEHPSNVWLLLRSLV